MGLGSGIRKKPIPDPGSRIQGSKNAPDPDPHTAFLAPPSLDVAMYRCAFLFVETYNDVITLEQTNRELAVELEEARDRLYQAQKDRKVETKELQDKSLALAEDLKRARAEAQKYKAGLEKTRFF